MGHGEFPSKVTGPGWPNQMPRRGVAVNEQTSETGPGLQQEMMYVHEYADLGHYILVKDFLYQNVTLPDLVIHMSP